MRNGAEKAITVALGTFPEHAEDAEATEEKKGQLGMTLRTLTPQLAEQLNLPRSTKGVVITDTEAGEAADDAGLAARDVIEKVNGVPVEDKEAFEREIEKARKTGLARLRVARDGRFFPVVLKIS
jgi:serine protease Do